MLLHFRSRFDPTIRNFKGTTNQWLSNDKFRESISANVVSCNLIGHRFSVDTMMFDVDDLQDSTTILWNYYRIAREVYEIDSARYGWHFVGFWTTVQRRLRERYLVEVFAFRINCRIWNEEKRGINYTSLLASQRGDRFISIIDKFDEIWDLYSHMKLYQSMTFTEPTDCTDVRRWKRCYPGLEGTAPAYFYWVAITNRRW